VLVCKAKIRGNIYMYFLFSIVASTLIIVFYPYVVKDGFLLLFLKSDIIQKAIQRQAKSISLGCLDLSAK
jgi:hypothetical protein